MGSWKHFAFFLSSSSFVSVSDFHFQHCASVQRNPWLPFVGIRLKESLLTALSFYEEFGGGGLETYCRKSSQSVWGCSSPEDYALVTHTSVKRKSFQGICNQGLWSQSKAFRKSPVVSTLAKAGHQEWTHCLLKRTWLPCWSLWQGTLNPQQYWKNILWTETTTELLCIPSIWHEKGISWHLHPNCTAGWRRQNACPAYSHWGEDEFPSISNISQVNVRMFVCQLKHWNIGDVRA